MQFYLPLLPILLSLSLPSLAGDFEEGLTAYQAGDYATALHRWTPLAEEGDASAQLKLGAMYDKGKGVPQEFNNAMKWYTRAAEQANADAQFSLGMMYHKGKGVLQDYNIATKWYKLAAEQGDAQAQFYLGVMYHRGAGVLQDNLYAHMWFDIAASLGSENASETQAIIAKRMTPTDISKARQLARECVAKDYKGC
ncbi:sel1 repeat family protein [Litorivicinus sp.]|nr:sel1 repeat family protein [Litorivicinus sp.]